MAYANLGLAYSDIGESVLSAESTTKAWQLRDRVSDREKFFIDFIYEREVTGNLEKAYQTLETWYQTYPRSEQPSPHDLLGGLSTHGTGRFERAIEISRQQIAADPTVVFGYHNLASSLFFLDRFPEAEKTLEQAAERKVEEPYLLVFRYTLAALKDDKEQMDRVVGSGQRQAWGGTLGGSRGGSRSGSFRSPTGLAAIVEPGCESGPARGAAREGSKLSGRTKRSGKPFAGILPKEKGTPWRRSSFRTAGTSNTPLALPWLFRETLLDQRRWPAI